MTPEQLKIINDGLSLSEKSLNRSISIASVPAIKQAYEQQLRDVQATRVALNQKDFFKS